VEIMFLKNLLKYNDAKSIVFKKLDELMHSNYESINIIDSWNKISFEDVAAPENLPMFDKSAMDGYALIAQDTFGASENNPIILNLVEEGNLIKSNECMKVSTGMAIPNGANSVVMKEYCIEGDNFVEVRKGVYPYENVSKMGEDVNKGDIIIKKGEIITPYHIALLSSLGIKNIKVYDINVGLISTGDELVDLNNIKDTKDIEKLKKRGNIINSNTPMLYALIKEMGFTPKVYGPVVDNKEKIKNTLLKAIMENDVVITTGGTSVGDRDYTIETIKEIGQLLLHGVQIRPGKPFGFGVFNLKDREIPIYILSGYPVALAVQFELFFRSYFRSRKTLYLPLNRNIPSTLGRVDMARVIIINKNNKAYVEPLRISGSGVISSIKRADGYIIIDENIEGHEKGDYVKVYLF